MTEKARRAAIAICWVTIGMTIGRAIRAEAEFGPTWPWLLVGVAIGSLSIALLSRTGIVQWPNQGRHSTMTRTPGCSHCGRPL